MSYGLPCLASDIPPHREVIVDGENGFLFAADNQEALRQRLGELIALGEETRQRISSAARTLVMQDYDWDAVVDQIEALYAEGLKRYEKRKNKTS
ncbi:MAG: glycosyltransferase [Bacillota bacterium]